MTITATSADVSGRSRRDLLILLVVLTLGLAAALQLLFVLPNHDSLWLLVAAERMLDGGTYERDFFEVNPPLAILVHAPSFLVAGLFGLDSYSSFIVVSLVYLGASLALLHKVVAAGFPPDSDFQRWLLPIAAVLLLILPGYDFGQREHLFSAFILPYLALHATRLPRDAGARNLTVLVSAWACLGLFLKPVLLLLPLLIAAEGAVRARSWRPLVAADMITIGAMGVIYTAAVLLRFPDYFAVARYAMEFYGAYQGHPILVTLVPLAYLAVGVALAVFAARTVDAPQETRMFTLLALAAGVATASALMQMKGWTYHILPIEIFVGTSTIMLVVIASARIRRKATNRTFALVARAAPLLVLALPLQSPGWTVGLVTRQQVADTELYATLAPVAAGKRLYVFSTSVIVGTKWLNAFGGEWASRFSCLWVLPGFLTVAEKGAISPERRDRLAADIRLAVEEDFERYRPEVVLVDRSEFKRGFETPFEFLDFFLADARFAAIWKSYAYYGTADGFEIYLLAGPAGHDDSTDLSGQAPRYDHSR